jgi:hypothetical protein
MIKYGIFAVLGTLFATFAIVYGLHRSSYCFGEARFVPDQEMVEAAIKDEVRVINVYASHKTGKNPGEQYLPINDVAHFKTLNPNCCKVLNGPEETNALLPYGLLDGIGGYYAVAVGINYKVRFLDMQGVERERAVYSTVPVSSCGHVELEVYRGG